MVCTAGEAGAPHLLVALPSALSGPSMHSCSVAVLTRQHWKRAPVRLFLWVWIEADLSQQRHHGRELCYTRPGWAAEQCI